MAPKHPEVLKDPPVASSSEEEEESGSSAEEESESSGEEDSKKDESSDEDEPVKPTQTNVAAPPPPAAATKKVAESESESESDSDPEPTKKKSQNTAPISSKPTKSNLPESSSTTKRSLKQTEDLVSNKKVKTNEDEAKKKISGDEAKQMFQRLFSETDEINLLQGILDFTSTRSWEIDGFCDYIKELIDFNANRSQLVTKIQRLKKRFANTVKNALKKGKSEDQIVFSKDLDEKIFDLSRKIWGSNGALETKSRRKLEGKPIDFKIKPHVLPKKKEETEKSLPLAIANVVSVASFSGSREIASFFKQENASSVGLDESAIIAGWDMVPDGPKKKEMEEKLKKLKAIQAGLCMKRSGIVNDCAKLIFKDHASSSGM